MSLEDQALTVHTDEDEQVDYDFAELDELAHAYAVTIHRSQGSEYPAVVIPLTTSSWMMLQRNLLYTGELGRSAANVDNEVPPAARTRSLGNRPPQYLSSAASRSRSCLCCSSSRARRSASAFSSAVGGGGSSKPR
jgi:UvrD-like helicase C-terminal domain